MTDFSPLESLLDGPEGCLPITALTPEGLGAWHETASERHRAWSGSLEFEAKDGQLVILPGDDGRPEGALWGLGEEPDLWSFAALPARLPAGDWRIEAPGAQADGAALAWLLGSYRFDRYKEAQPTKARLAWPEGADRAEVARLARATFLVRDLINTPAADMGPAELETAARTLAEAHGATIEVITGEALLEENYPAVHAVGCSSPREPRLIDLSWGPEDAPKLTLVGKGVCFDTGGLDIKPASAMRLMKKDMGGAAHVLGLAALVMDAGLKVRLRVLVPAVENSVSGRAMRPGDVVATRGGKTIEIGHTDAEGRVILADALVEASREEPEVLIDFATLTGAARVALGAEVPAVFATRDDLANDLMRLGAEASDMVWRLPLWKPYRRHIDGKCGDLSNDSDAPYGGAITAALFLNEFVEGGIPWVHVDLMAWNGGSRPGRPEGGEAMGLRATWALIRNRFGD